MSRHALGLLFAASFHAGSFGNGCAHTGAAFGHVAAAATRAAIDGAIVSAEIADAAARSVPPPEPEAPPPEPEAPPPAPAPPRADPPAVLPEAKCRSAEDCGDGVLEHGTVCDRTRRGNDPNAVGVCREACRDDRDCPPAYMCVYSLDPVDASWAGCVPRTVG
jgi:hypothetical protein